MNGLIKRGKAWTIRYTVPNGKRKWEAIGTSKRQAELVLAKRKLEIKEGRYFSTPKGLKWTYGQLLDRYLEYGRVTKKASTSKAEGYLGKQIRAVFGDVYLKDVTPEKVQMYLEGKLAARLSASTANYHLSILKHSFSMAIKWGLLQTNPLSEVKLPVKINNARQRYLTPEEITRLLEMCTPHWRNVALVALYTGMRKGEILTLRWDQIDWTGGFARLPDTKNGDARLVPLSSAALQVFRGLQEQAITSDLQSPHVFVNPKTKRPYNPTSHKTWDRILKSAGFDDLHFHDLRHTMASHLRMSGVDLLTIGEILGHRDLRMTKRYAHIAPAHKLAAVALLETSFREPAHVTKTPVLAESATSGSKNGSIH